MSGAAATALERLGDPALYAAQIDRLQARAAGRGYVEVTRDGGLPLARLVQDRDRLARLIARDVARGRYAPAPAQRREVAAGKLRVVFSFALPDLVVHGAIAQLLHAAMEPRMPDEVHSYRRGRSAARAVARFAAYVRAHRAAAGDPRARGLHVVRADVRAYGDSVPVGDDSPLWAMIEELVPGAAPHERALLRATVRPEVRGDGARQVGLATGSPVATALGNLYLTPLDRRLAALGDGAGFYARYGDDLVFAHPERAAADEAVAVMRAQLAALGLALNEEKQRSIFLNAPGRASAEGAPGAPAVELLGARVAADGAVGLTRAKLRDLRGELRRRVARTARLLRGAPIESRGRALAGAVAAALEPGAPAAVRHAAALRAMVTDRRQLAELDGWMWRQLASALTGVDGARALRLVPPRRLRGWGLPSLVAARNQRGDDET